MKLIKIAFNAITVGMIISSKAVYSAGHCYTIKEVGASRHITTIDTWLWGNQDYYQVIEETAMQVKEQSIKTRALKLAHAIRPAYISFSSALRVAYRVLRSRCALHQVMRGLSNAAHLCGKLGLKDKSYTLAKAYSVLFCLPVIPALKR